MKYIVTLMAIALLASCTATETPVEESAATENTTVVESIEEMNMDSESMAVETEIVTPIETIVEETPVMEVETTTEEVTPAVEIKETEADTTTNAS